jgi:hypothetical protein
MMEASRQPAVKSVADVGVKQYRRGPSRPEPLSIHGTVAEFRDRIVGDFAKHRIGGERFAVWAARPEEGDLR